MGQTMLRVVGRQCCVCLHGPLVVVFIWFATDNGTSSLTFFVDNDDEILYLQFYPR